MVSDLTNDQGVNEGRLDQGADGALGTDPFVASLNKLLEKEPEWKSVFDSLISLLDDDDTAEETVEVECAEIDGNNYIVAQRMEIEGNTYLQLVNENDCLDFIFQKVIVEDGEEYIVELDSDKEFELVQSYFQRNFLIQLKEKLEKDDKDTSGDQ